MGAVRVTLLAAASLLSTLAACTTQPLDSGASSTATCSHCHGSEANAAPPSGLHDESRTDQRGVGAHQLHLGGSAIARAVACAECHPVPEQVESPTHPNDVVDVVFGPLASRGGLSPRFDAASGTCVSVYCHGGTLAGGKKPSPGWTYSGAAPGGCDSCHGAPPPGSAHQGEANRCHDCHSATIREDGSVNLEGGAHLDGRIQAMVHSQDGWEQGPVHGSDAKKGLAACAACHGAELLGEGSAASCEGCHAGWRSDCTFCHGDPGRPDGSPPADNLGRTATSEVTVGAHLSHLSASKVSAPIACAECHLVPAKPIALSHVQGDLPRVVFGPLARSGGLSPTWDRAPPGTCANTYCHGAALKDPPSGTTPAGGTHTTPKWTVVDGTEAACGGCHAIPPPAHAPTCAAPCTPDPRSCNACHSGTVKPDGTLDLAGGLHLNGTVEGIHPDPAWPTGAVHGAEANKDLSLPSSSCRSVDCHGANLTGGVYGSSCDRCHKAGWRTDCTFCHQGGGGAHASHVNVTPISKAIGCEECHVLPADIFTAGHIDGISHVQFSATSRARARGATPLWLEKSKTCAGVYCHGANMTLFYDGSGGKEPAPAWNGPAWPNPPTTQVTCWKCHGYPPGQPHVEPYYSCSVCHQVFLASGALNVERHLDGKYQCNTANGFKAPECDEK